MTQLTDTDGNTVIRLRNLWEWVFKAFLCSCLPVLAAAFLQLMAMYTMLNRHESVLSGLQREVSDGKAHDERQDNSISQLNKTTAEINGRLHGLSSLVGKIQGRTVKELARDEN